LPAILGWGVKTVLAGLVVSVILRYLWLWIIFTTNGKLQYSKSFVKEYLKLGSPLVLATLLGGSAQFVDGFIITSHFDEQTFAIFRYGARELPLALLLANALNNALLPGFSDRSRLSANLLQLKTSVSRLMHFLFPLSALLIVISYPLFPIIFNPNFAQSATVFNIYLLLVVSRLLLPQTILNGLKMTRPIMTAAFFELIINVGTSLLLVRYLGIAGVAYGTLIAYVFEKVYLAVSVHKKLNISIYEYISIKLFLFYSIALGVVFILTELLLKPLF
jgi:O-antigen/teichoic acid export membrane protein